MWKLRMQLVALKHGLKQRLDLPPIGRRDLNDCQIGEMNSESDVEWRGIVDAGLSLLIRVGGDL